MQHARVPATFPRERLQCGAQEALWMEERKEGQTSRTPYLGRMSPLSELVLTELDVEEITREGAHLPHSRKDAGRAPH